jgi:hypothetical protein
MRTGEHQSRKAEQYVASNGRFRDSPSFRLRGGWLDEAGIFRCVRSFPPNRLAPAGRGRKQESQIPACGEHAEEPYSSRPRPV